MTRDDFDETDPMDPFANRVVPQDLDAEGAVISALLLCSHSPEHSAAFETVLSTLRQEHFFSESNARIYEAIVALHEAGTPIDVVSVASWLRSRNRINQVGGAAYIATLADAIPAVGNIIAHADVVFEKWLQRSAGAIGHRLAAQSYGDVGEVVAWISGVAADLQALSGAKNVRSGEFVGDILRRLFNQQVEDPTAATGRKMPTGYARYDEKTVGNKRGRVTVIAGRPGSGKSSFARGASVGVAKVARGEETGVVIFSMEMTKEEVAMYMLCSEASVDARRWENNLLLDAEWSALTSAAARIAHLGIIIDDTPSLSLADIRSRIVQYAAEYDRPAEGDAPERRIGVVVVDYIQLMKGAGRKGQNRQQEIGENSRGLKRLAKEFGVWVIELSQMNRSVEKEQREPQLSDLREAGDIEQDADEVTFIHQPPDGAEDDGGKRRGKAPQDEDPDEKGIAKIIIRKQRGGPKCTVKMRWFPEHTRFSDLAYDCYS